MKRLLAIALLAVACRSEKPLGPVDLVLMNGRFFTGGPFAEAVAIRGNRIVAIGKTVDLEKLQTTRGIDLLGKLVVPGINDAHVHQPWVNGGEQLEVPPNTPSGLLLRMIRDKTERTREGTWIQVHTFMEPPDLTRASLDRIAPRHPVAVRNFAGHRALLNSAALKAWNITNSDGWLYENALWTKDRAATEAASDAELVATMKKFANEAVRYGLTTVQSMPSAHPDRVAPLVAQINVPLRWRWIEVEMGTVPDDPKWPTKYIADGTPVERDAAMREPYSDQPNTRGAMNFTDDQIRRAVEVAAKSKQQLLFHAAGELPIEKFFAAMKSVRADWPAKRVRVEHGDFIAEFLPDAKRLGVIVVQNPSHFMIADIVRARFGPERLKNFQAFRSLIEAGIPVAIGSDGPINPWQNIMFATMHPTNPKEAITVEQALIAYTRGSARAEFTDAEKGKIAVGYLADLAVLSQDIFKVPLPDLPKTESVLTIIDGRVVWEGGSDR
jgi:hypothetical protein